MTIAERFWSKVEFTDTCWLWTGSQTNGYGQFWPSHGEGVQAYRYAYEFCVGPIPDGLELDHLCRIHACVLPDHLEPVTHRENVLRGVSIVAQNARKTHCWQGHPYSDENTYLRPPDSSRICRACSRENDARRRLMVAQ